MKTRIFVHRNAMALIFLAFPLFAHAQKHIDLAFDGIKTVYMVPPKGHCEIRKSPDAQVKIELSTHYKGDKVPVYSIVQRGDSLKVEQKDHPGSVSGSIPEWILWVPDETKLFYKTGNGGIDVKNLTASLTVETGKGNISISQSSGVFKIKTGNGDISVTGLHLLGACEINVAKGNCTLDMKEHEINARLTLQLSKKSKAVMPFQLEEGKTFSEQGNNETWTEKSITLGSANNQILMRSGNGNIKLIK
jgi:hypothetical protein